MSKVKDQVICNYKIERIKGREEKSEISFECGLSYISSDPITDFQEIIESTHYMDCGKDNKHIKETNNA